MKKQYLVASFNSMLVPLAVFCGMMLEIKNYPMMFLFLISAMGLEFIVTFLWFEINKEIHTK
ncbi:MAG: hypothetical protein ACREA8_01460 [Nitrosotalea sp.]